MDDLTRLKNRINKKLYETQFSIYSVLFFAFILALLVALAAVIISSVTWTKTTGNATICENCDGIVGTVSTDNGILIPIIDQTLKFRGVSGIKTSIRGIDNITWDNLRDITPYTVDSNGGSEFLTPQEAYNQAVADGRGGTGLPAVIIIAPGTYDFGDTQFPITQPGISWVSLPAVPGVSGGVVFTASGLNGGIYVNIAFDAFTNMIFQGITFGGINDENGFLLNVTGGQTVLVSCGSLNSNFRIYLGGEDFVVFSAFESTFKTLPPNDFITSLSEFVYITMESCNFIQLYTGGSPVVTQGGHIFNFEQGIGQVTLIDHLFLISHYLGVISGPNTTNNAFISVYGTRVNTSFTDPLYPYFMKINGKCTIEITRNHLSLQGPLIYIPLDLISGDGIDILLANSVITSRNTTIKSESTVTTIGNINMKIVNSYLVVAIDDYIIDIQNANLGDTLAVLLAGTTLTTQAPALGDYAIGPGAAFATITVGGSFSTNGATTANNFLYVPLTPL